MRTSRQMSFDHALVGLHGYLLDAPTFGALRSRVDGALILDGSRIIEVGEYELLRKRHPANTIRWRHFPGCVLLPGLIDLHTHLPQYPAVAHGEEELLPWLRRFIFPFERDFTGPRAKRECPLFFQELARHGTTTAMVYSAIFEDSCDVAFEHGLASGLRLIIGKSMMDVASYGTTQPRKIVSISLLESERLCAKWHGADEGRIEYAFSPRFAVACTEKLMRGAAELAEKYGAYVQTHLAESREELEKVRHLFMWSKDYAHVYETCGLLNPRAVLGHAIHLTDIEIQRVAAGGAAVAHCPSSNLFLGSGIMPFDRLHAAGIRIGLGSDVAAGPELNMWQVMRSAVESQKMRAYYESLTRTLRPVEAFYLATTGGAAALGKQEVIGRFEKGLEADILAMNIHSLLPYRPASRTAPIPSELTPEDLIALLVYRGGPHAVLESMVRGRTVYAAPQPSLFDPA